MLKYEGFVRKLSGISTNVATALLLILLLINCADIVGAKFFNFPFPGAVELTGYGVAVLVPCAAALVFLCRQHIRIEIVTDKLPQKVKDIIDRIIALVLFVLFALLTWKILAYGMSKQNHGEYSSTLNFPFYIIIYLMALAFVPLCLAFILDLICGPRKEGS